MDWNLSLIEFCCERMSYAVNFQCPDHPNPFDCPDHIVYYSEQNREYGLIVYDGGGSYIMIEFCPWCGKRLSLA